MTNSTLLPAIRTRVGDWIFYSASMTFEQVKCLVKSPDEVHERKGLSSWIQREAIDKHANEIANYIKSNEQRFLGALVIGVYDGSPSWVPLEVSYSNELVEIPEDQKKSVTGKLGLLKLSGGERLFAIDGQHRVSGIKKALESEKGGESRIGLEEVTTIFVSHDASSEAGKQRTRRLFTTLNKKAKRISSAAIIALDEDNGFAIVTRRLIDSHWLFEDERNHISYTGSGAINSADESTITSVVGLYEIVTNLYKRNAKGVFKGQRPQDEELDDHFKLCSSFLDLILVKCEEFNKVFVNRSMAASSYRLEDNSHLLFRPAGQQAFSKATELLMQRGDTLESAIDKLLNSNLYLHTKDWHNILWDPINKGMITNKAVFAKTQLLSLSGERGRNRKNEQRLAELIDERDNT